MKIKKIATKLLISLCVLSGIVLFIVIFAGCTASLDSASKNLTQYDIEVDYNSSFQTLTCGENVSYINKTDNVLNYLAFHLYPNAFRQESISPPVSFANRNKAYPNGLSYGNIEITSVAVSNSPATYCEYSDIVQPTSSDIRNLIKNNNIKTPQYFIGGEDENILYVLFPGDLYPNERINISIKFKDTLPNINHRYGYGENTVNIANFYPIACVYANGEFDTSLYHLNGDPFFSEMSNYVVKLSVPCNFVVSNTGAVTNQENRTVEELVLTNAEEGGTQSTALQNIEKTIYTIKANAVRDFAMVISTEFNVISQKVGKTEVKYYYFSDDNSALSLETSVKALKTFNELIGEYPYSTLSVVEANFLHGGMEYPNLVYISNEVTDNKSYQKVIIHEIAHQWWYNLVGNSAFSYSWLDEGLTEYTTVLFYQLHPEYDVKMETVIANAYSSYSIFIEIYTKVYGDVDTSMDRELDDFGSEQEYVHVAYVKGMLLFDSLREILGYDRFIKCLKDYFSNNIYQNVTPAHLISSFEKTSKRDLESFFNAWIEGNIILLK
jgi:hypothetical protein